MFIRQNSTGDLQIGPAVSISDGFTLVTNLDVSTADAASAVLGGDGSVVDISGFTWAASTADGMYDLTMTTAISDTVGEVGIVIEDVSLTLPIYQRFYVVEEVVFDAMYAASAAGFLATSTLTIAEPAQGKPTVTPTAEQILNYLYVQLIRNKTVTRSDGTDFFYVYNDAGTAIYKKAIADAASIFTVSESESGP
jgi:hypothetical protein